MKYIYIVVVVHALAHMIGIVIIAVDNTIT